MRLPELLPLSFRRYSPTRLGLLPLIVGMLLALRWTMTPPRLHPALLVWPLAMAVGYLLLAPLPWLWTGDERTRPSHLRGLGQAVAVNALWLALAAITLRLWLGDQPMEGLFMGPVVRDRLVHSGLPWWAFFELLHLPLSSAIGWFIAEKDVAERERLLAEAREATLAIHSREAQALSLQAQLDPHVLYNALGGIAELIHEDPDKAETALLDLADLLRRLTRYGRQLRCPLGQERELVTQYLALESLRLEGRLQVSWTWDPALDALPAPPLLLQPLAENAIQHGLSRLKGGGRLQIRGRREPDGTVVLQVENEGPTWSPERAREGTGLGNLRQRLALLGGARLDMRSEAGWTRACIRLSPEVAREP
nr:histidine kinase [uncultured Holophaga sp.]